MDSCPRGKSETTHRSQLRQKKSVCEAEEATSFDLTGQASVSKDIH